jgi:hypothetical protein
MAEEDPKAIEKRYYNFVYKVKLYVKLARIFYKTKKLLIGANEGIVKLHEIDIDLQKRLEEECQDKLPVIRDRLKEELTAIVRSQTDIFDPLLGIVVPEFTDFKYSYTSLRSSPIGFFGEGRRYYESRDYLEPHEKKRIEEKFCEDYELSKDIKTKLLKEFCEEYGEEYGLSKEIDEILLMMVPPQFKSKRKTSTRRKSGRNTSKARKSGRKTPRRKSARKSGRNTSKARKSGRKLRKN